MQALAKSRGPDDMQAGSALEGWDSTDMDDFQEASSEVDGVPPSLHLLADPTIAIHIPITQVFDEHSIEKRTQAMPLIEPSLVTDPLNAEAVVTHRRCSCR